MDIQSLYDTVLWEHLVATALGLNFPPVVLMLEFQLCTAARTLPQFSSTSCAFQVAQSIAQGLRNGARFGQCCTHFTLKKLTTANPR
eukprot:4250601-Pyramimonas_sp.AAC.1